MSVSFVSQAVPAEISQSLIAQSTQKDTHTSDHIHDGGGVVRRRQARLVPAEVQAKIDSGLMKLQHWKRTRTQSSRKNKSGIINSSSLLKSKVQIKPSKLVSPWQPNGVLCSTSGTQFTNRRLLAAQCNTETRSRAACLAYFLGQSLEL